MALWQMYGVNVVEIYGQTETAGGIVSGQRGLEAGAAYYLTKGSFHDETLLQAVVDLIGEPDA